MEQKRGFIHDMLDVKVLLLCALAQLKEPAEFPTLLEVCLQDDGVDYFELREAVTQLVRTGHLTEDALGHIALTDLGREHGALTEDSLALTVRQRVRAAVDAWQGRQARQNRVQTQVVQEPDGACTVSLTLNSPVGQLMRLELSAPSLKQARLLSTAMYAQAETLYAHTLDALLAHEKTVDKAL